ncbi:MAG: sulfotransferase family 2 domain-containing protein [Xenococcaceae cyanobacterium MO_188.B32]|nr:sulfotransferase family 2 domain-containing protein [Xenococcaceae cyanobacterium MO_188.B32]
MTRELKMESVFIGVHIPKTAGTTLIKILEKEFGFNGFHQTTNLQKNADIGIPFIEEMHDNSNYKVLFGHHIDEKTLFHFLNRNIYLFTFIREPIQRILSQYRFCIGLAKRQNSQPIDFDSFYSALQKNLLCNWIISRFPSFLDDNDISLPLHQKAIKILRCFRFICSTEEFDSKVVDLLGEMKVSSENMIIPRANVSGQKNVEMEFDLETIRNDNKEDIALYSKFCEARKINFLAQNPLIFDSDYYQRKILELSSQSYNKQQRLKSCFNQAAREYKSYGNLEREIKKTKIDILNKALKLEVLLSQFNNLDLQEADFSKKIEAVIDSVCNLD